MSHGARNWPFFTLIARPVSPAATRRSVCRQRKAGICSTSTACGGRRALLGRVHVGQHRHAEPLAHLREDLQAPRHADAARGAGAGAVGLVVAALVDHAARPSRRRSRRVRRPPPARGRGFRSGTGRRSARTAGRWRSRCRRRGRFWGGAVQHVRHGRACPGHPRGPRTKDAGVQAWMPGTSPGMTTENPLWVTRVKPWMPGTGPGHDGGRSTSHQPRLPHRGGDEAAEQRMRLERLRFQLRDGTARRRTTDACGSSTISGRMPSGDMPEKRSPAASSRSR